MAFDPLNSAKILQSALPYMQRYSGRTIVIKYGGHAMINEELADSFARDIALMQQVGIHPVVVHGGGPQINQALETYGIKGQFINGLRVTDKKTVEIVEMVLAGKLNKQIVSSLNLAGGCAVGVCGRDAKLVRARKVSGQDGVDLGFVGEPEFVDPRLLTAFETTGIIPVIAPVASDKAGQSYNINADVMAGAIAAAIGAVRLLMLTDIAGVLDADKNLLKQLSLDDCDRLLQAGVINGGMIPKIETCKKAVESGVEAAAIIDGRVENAVLLELFTDHGVGTIIAR